MMSKEVLKAKADTMTAWADEFRDDKVQGMAEIAFLLERAAKLARTIANGEKVVFEPPPAQPEASVDEPRAG